MFGDYGAAQRGGQVLLLTAAAGIAVLALVGLLEWAMAGLILLIAAGLVGLLNTRRQLAAIGTQVVEYADRSVSEHATRLEVAEVSNAVARSAERTAESLSGIALGLERENDGRRDVDRAFAQRLDEVIAQLAELSKGFPRIRLEAREVSQALARSAEQTADSLSGIALGLEREGDSRLAIERALGQRLDEVIVEVSELRNEFTRASGSVGAQVLDVSNRLDAAVAETERSSAEVSFAIASVSQEAANLGGTVDAILQDGLPEIAAKIDSSVKSARSEFDRTKKRNIAVSNQLRIIATEPASQFQALLQLRDNFRTEFHRMPLLSGWALDPSTVRLIVDHIDSSKPRLVLECGSGSSTVWMAEALKNSSGGTLVSLEHDSHYVELAQRRLLEFGLDGRAEVLHAPLRKWNLGGSSVDWYTLDALALQDGIDLLVVDGPPAATGPMARYPAVPLLLEHLNPGALIVLDDARRPDERAIVERWKVEGLVAPDVQTVHSAVLLRAGGRVDSQA